MPDEKLNIHQKLLKIADAAGVLRKTKEGFGYRYVPEEEIQAKVTANMQKLGVMLYSEIVPGTLKVLPYSYEKFDKKLKQIVPVNEIIVSADSVYTWVNTENPEDKIVIPWSFVGQMEDAAQSMGSGLTYSNRYFLMKALQLATTEDDPDNYRSKQKAAENYEEDKKQRELTEALNKAKTEVKDMGTVLINKGIPKETVMGIVGKYNGGNKNPSSITSVEVCNSVIKDFEKALKEKSKIKETKEDKQ